uniref:calcium-binding protein n=1 Tax=Methylobacillus flagellatus TaxID=405 RepID=UPI002570CEB4
SPMFRAGSLTASFSDATSEGTVNFIVNDPDVGQTLRLASSYSDAVTVTPLTPQTNSDSQFVLQATEQSRAGTYSVFGGDGTLFTTQIASLVRGTEDGDMLGNTNLSATIPQIVYGFDGADTLTTGGGNDFLFGGDNNDTITGGAGNDLLSGGNGDDSLFGGEGNDTLTGGVGTNSLNGEAGDDTILHDTGTDILGTYDGGDGIDTLVVAVSEFFGTDFGIQIDDISDASLVNIENLVISGVNGQGDVRINLNLQSENLNISVLASNTTGNITVIDGNGNDTITGGVGNDTLFARDGNDVLSGGAGDDYLFGGNGAEILTGGMGSDTFAYSRLSIGGLGGTYSTLTAPDTITDFVSGVDVISMSGGLPDVPGSATSYREAASSGSTIDANLAAANAVFAGSGNTVSYYLTDDGNGTGLLFIDSNNRGERDGMANGVIKLVGITQDNFAFTDIIA